MTTPHRDGLPSDGADLYARLTTIAETDGTDAMFDSLARSLRDRRRWHALFDLRLMQARTALGIPLHGDLTHLPLATRDALDKHSIAACREAGWPLIDEGHVAAGWMYLRAAVEPGEMSLRLAAIADAIAQPAGHSTVAATHPSLETYAMAPDGMAATPADEAADQTIQEVIHVALWEGVDPSLGLTLLLARNGTCNAITAYEQAISRLPFLKQQPAARVLVDHLHREVLAALAGDSIRRGVLPQADSTSAQSHPNTSIVAMMEAAGGMDGDQAIHVDVSHLQSVLRIARVCTDTDTVDKAWELACYGCRLPTDATYPGEPPFENVAAASRLFFNAQRGHDIREAIAFFRSAAVTAQVAESGTLPADTLVLLLWRLNRPAEALHAALQRPQDEAMASTMQASGLLPSLVELAAAGNAWDALREACRLRGDEITFAATLAEAARAPFDPLRADADNHS